MGPPPFGERNRDYFVIPADDPPLASMGPPPFGERNALGAYLFVLQAVASMGPPPFGERNYITDSISIIPPQLQWGRRLSASGIRGPQ